jgi:hypothetical protein
MSNDSANQRITNFTERVAIGLLSIVLSMVVYAYQGVVRDTKDLQVQVTQMQMNKVNKEDLRETETRLNTKIDAAFNSLAARGEANKVDLIQRLDMYFGQIKKR